MWQIGKYIETKFHYIIYILFFKERMKKNTRVHTLVKIIKIIM
jgi:hypothetical protein